MVIAVFFLESGASSIEDLKKEIEAKNQEIQKLEEQEKQFKQSITKTQKTSKTLANQIVSIEKSVKNINSEIKINEAKIARAALEIKVLREEILAKENEISSGKRGMAGIFRLIYERDKEGYYAMVIKNSTLSSFLAKFNEFALIQNKFREYLS